MINNELNSLIIRIKQYLPHYIKDVGVDIDDRGFMKCLNPAHNDKNPSMSLVPKSGDTVTHCFSCGANYNIFHVAKIFNNLPNKGIDFFRVTIPTLANKYFIPYNEKDLELSEETVNKYRYKAIYQDVLEVFKEQIDFTHTATRGWNNQFCLEYGIGTIKDFNKFINQVAARGDYSVDELLEKDIHNRLFGPHLLTFTIFDSYQSPCGFAARNMLFTKEDKSTHPKYRNSSSEVPIYHKNKILYGLPFVTDVNARLDIFEGYPDWVTAKSYGHNNCAALGCLTFNDGHLTLLQSLGYKHINLVLDGDEVGIKKTDEYINLFSKNNKDIKVTVTLLTFDDDVNEKNRDPDDFIKQHGLQAYFDVQPMNLFDWKLEKEINKIKKHIKETNVDIEEEELKARWTELASKELMELVTKMIPLILSDTSAVERGRMCAKLSRYTGANEADIRTEVNNRSNLDIKNVGDNVLKKLKNSKDSLEIKSIIDEAHARILQASVSRDIVVFNHDEVQGHLITFLNDCDNPKGTTTGWRTGWDCFDDPISLGGIPKKESIFTFAGPPNHGKSALLMNILKQLILPAQNNKNLTAMLWYLDDSRNVAWSKLLGSLTTESILNVRRPQLAIYKDPEKTKLYNGWKDYLTSCVADKRLLVKGHEIGSDINSLEYWIKHTQDTTGNDVVVFIDAAHDMTTGSAFDNDDTSRLGKVYDWFQSTTERLAYTVLTCAHITKAGISKGRPEPSDLSDSKKILYASKYIGLVYSELDHLTSISKKDSCSTYWVDLTNENEIDQMSPIIEVNICKNKETSRKGSIYFKHKATACYLEPLSTEEIKIIRSNNNRENANLSDIRRNITVGQAANRQRLEVDGEDNWNAIA